MSTVFRAPNLRAKRGFPAFSAWLTVGALALLYSFAISRGVLSIDVARDAFWGQRIALGELWPLVGPPVGTSTLLGPVWYYVVALALSVTGSFTTYFALIGLIAASKFALAYAVGRRWLGPAFGVSLAVASAAPGIASYQLLGIGHPWFIESTLWLSAWCALRLYDAPARLRFAFGVGVAMALALHAHPTAILLLPWALIALLSLPRGHRWRALVAVAVGGVLVFLPVLVALLWPEFAAAGAADNATAAGAAGGLVGVGGNVSGALPILQNMVWTQSQHLFNSFLQASPLSAGIAAVLWCGVLLASMLGLFRAWRQPRLRGTLIGAALSLLWAVVAVSLLRNHTPFYMAFVALLPFAVLLAVAWLALLGNGSFWECCLWGAVLLATVSLHAATAFGLAWVARDGAVNSYLPLHSNMQDVTTAVHPESVFAAPTRDALARWLCAQPQAVSLHGDLAAAFDVGLHLDTDWTCPLQRRADATGGHTHAYVGLPSWVWARLGVSNVQLVGAYGLVHAKQVFSPTQALVAANGRRYPPRFDLMIGALQRGLWSVNVGASAREWVVVSSLLPTLPSFSVSASANGVQQPARLSFANSVLFRCDGCAPGPIDWRLNVSGALPETLSISTVDSGEARASASLSP